MYYSRTWLQNLASRFFRRSRSSSRRPRLTTTSRYRRARVEPLECRYAPAGIDFAHGFGSDLNDLARSSDFDEQGNVYVTGTFQGTVDIDPGDSVLELTSNGGEDIFVAKFSPDGELVWAISAGGVADDAGNDLDVLFNGSFAVVGHFQGTVDFDPSAATDEVTASGSDGFLWKLNADGEHQSVVRTTGSTVGGSGSQGPENDLAIAVARDASAGIYVLLNDFVGGNQQVTIEKYSFGSFEFRRTFGGTSTDSGADIAVDSAGNIFVTGSFRGTVDFNPGAGKFLLKSAGTQDCFAAKFTRDGDFVWARRFGGSSSSDSGSAIALGSQGRLYVAGQFSSSADFDPGKGVANVTSAGGLDGFLVQLTTTGQFVRARQLGGGGIDSIGGLATDPGSGDVYVTGLFASTVDFDLSTGSANKFELTSAGSLDAFVARYTANLGLRWAIQMGGESVDDARSIAVDGRGTVSVVGSFASEAADFDPGLADFELLSAGEEDAFVWQMTENLVVNLDQDYERLKLSRVGSFLVLQDEVTGDVLESRPPELVSRLAIGSNQFAAQTLTIDFGDFGFFEVPEGVFISLPDDAETRVLILGDGDTRFSVAHSPSFRKLRIEAVDPVNPAGTGPSTTISIDDNATFEFGFADTVTLVTPSTNDDIVLAGDVGLEGEAASAVTGVSGSLTLPTILLHDVARFVLDSAANDTNATHADRITFAAGAFNAQGLEQARFKTGAGDDEFIIQIANFQPQVEGGAFTLEPGSGIDSLTLESDAEVVGLVDAVVVTTRVGGFRLGTMFISGFEKATLIGSSNDNLIDAEEFTGHVTLLGGEGNDELFGSLRPGSVNVLDGGDGDDSLRGGSGNDVIDGGAGDDDIHAGPGHNNVAGGTGDDHITTGAGNDVITGGDGNDQIAAGFGNNTIDAGDGQDQIVTGSGNDSITAGEGDDTVESGAGNDTIDAGDGDDTVNAGTGDDVIFAGSGLDDVIGGTGNDQIEGGDGDDRLDGGTGNDRLIGGGGIDVLLGGDGRDYLKGDEGNDELNGGAGTDTMDGCLDLDTFDTIEIFLNCDVEDPLGPL